MPTYLNSSYLAQYAIGDVLRIGFHGLGTEMDGEHPGIFVGCTSGVQYATIVPLTKTASARLAPSTMVIKRSAINNLDVDSVAVVHQMTCIDPAYILQKLGCLSGPELSALQTIMKNHLHLP